jgi:chromosomal replication initiator protein
MIPRRIELIETAISEAAGVSISSMRGKQRHSEFVMARMAVWYVAYEYCNYSYKAISRLYDRDHSTIMHGVAKIKKNEQAASKIIEGIKKVYPEVFEDSKGEEVRGMEHWEFR